MELDERHSFDACVIGSGFAGVTLAMELADAGLDVVVLESGFNLASNPDPRVNQLDVFANAGSIEYPLLGTRVRALGGTSYIWTGNCYRFYPEDIERNPYASSVGPWPLTYAELEHWYERAERTLRVQGPASGPPRRTELPVNEDAKPTTELHALVKPLGLTLEQFPRSRSRRSQRDPVRVMDDLLPAATDSPRVTVVTGATVTRLEADASGTVVAAEAWNLDREMRRIRARTYVVAAGGVESARLLLLSRSAAFPSGLGNASDHVGRHFMEHLDINFRARLPGRIAERSERGRSYDLHREFLSRGLGGLTLTFTRKRDEPEMLAIGCGVPLFPCAANRIVLSADLKDYFENPAPVLSFGLCDEDQAAFAAARDVVQRLYRELGATEIVEEPGFHWSHHHMGTCRMGVDPAQSVVDADLRVHGVGNLHVLSSAVFSTSGAGHPTVLIIALAHRLAEHLAASHDTARLSVANFRRA
jgi:choline dehydrogenase-like flavoprotein